MAAALLLGGCGGADADAQGGSACTLSMTSSAAAAGGAGPAAQAAAIDLLFSDTELRSAGAPGAEVGVTALVKDRANAALAGANGDRTERARQRRRHRIGLGHQVLVADLVERFQPAPCGAARPGQPVWACSLR